jgi:hypothetical protein
VVHDGLIYTNQRRTILAARFSDLARSPLKDHVTQHFVEKDEIAGRRMSFDRRWDRMETQIDAAVGTMSDVRDEVIKLTSKAVTRTCRWLDARPRRRGRDGRP